MVGQSDSHGAYPVSRPISPADIHATGYAALGYDPQAVAYRTLEGRPMTLAEGRPIAELF